MFIAMLVVPAALLATIVLLSATNKSFNIMTLGGMSAAVGLVIDDAIVMVEQIIRRVRGSAARPKSMDGDGPANSTALRAAAKFTRPFVGSSAATIVIFLPLAMLGGITGTFFKALSLTMAGSLVFSFLITWLASPARGGMAAGAIRGRT
jgi:multidrug efflux pump subunit AcrB